MAAERRANGGAAGPAVPPRAAPWEQVFRRTEVPLFVEDIARARASIREVAAAVGTDGLRGWLDAHPDFIGRIIAEVQVIDVNDAAVRLNAAASREELLVSLDKLVLPESLPAFKDLICMLAGDARLYEGQSCYRALDGREYHTLNRADIPAADDPDQLLVIATVEITDLKATEQALVESEERYRVLVETAKDVILRHDLAGKITFLNRAGRELLGRDETDLATLTAQQLLTERALPAALDRAAARRRGEDGVLLYETEYRHKGGRIVPVEVSSTLLPAALGGTGEPQVLLVARDISIRRRLQAEQDRLAGRLRDAHKNESLGVLAGGIAHDFNNLLVTILGNAEMLRADVGDGAGAPNIDAIIGAGRQAAELCRQMVAYAGTAPTEAGPGDVSEIIGGTRGLLAATVSGGAHLGFELATDLPAVAVEPARFRQAVLNLVTNANEALGTEGGEIVVRTGMRDPSGAEPAGWWSAVEPVAGPHVFCEVRDSGRGMADDVISRVCDPFFSTRERGRGLGLSTVLGFVNSHGGALQIDTAPGRGTRVAMWLPVPAVLPPASRRRLPARAPEPEIDLGGRTVLMVEDEADVREVGESFLRRLGCRVLSAADGYEAVRIFGQRHAEIDVVLLDYTMPGLDGVGTGKRLRVIRPEVPIVLTSGREEAEVRARCADLSPAGFLAKPFSLRDVRAVIGGVFAP